MTNLQMMAFTAIVALLGLMVLIEMVMDCFTKSVIKRFHSRKD